MSKAFKVNVQKVKWVTSNNGFVKPVAVLDKLFKKKDVEFDSIGINHAATVEKMKIGEGSVLRISVKNESINIISSVKDSKPELPRRCPSCKDNLLSHNKENLYCPNDFCNAKSRTPIIKLIKTCCDSIDTGKIYEYINTFPVNNKKNIHNCLSIMDFLQVWIHAGDKSTNFRYSLLENTYKEKVLEMEKIEKAINEKLTNGLSMREMWDIATIYGLKSEYLSEVSTINFSALSSKSYQDQVVELDIPTDMKLTLGLNEQYMKNLFNNFNTIRQK